MPKQKIKTATPERVLLEAEVDSVSLPTQMGEITILPHHIPLVASLAPGEIRVQASGVEKYMAVSGGVLEVKTGNEIVILADAAEAEEEIDAKRAAEARERARKIMS